MIRKRISSIALSIILLLCLLLQPASAANAVSVFVNGVKVERAASTLYGDTTYVSLRYVTQALRPDATVSWQNNCAYVTASNLSMSALPDSCYLQANGRYLYLPSHVRLVNGLTLVPVQTLAQALGAKLERSGDNIYLTSGASPIAAGSSYYNSDDLYWLSHIIFAESGNQSLEGKIGVGNVVLNRVKSPLFPNTIKGVIFQANQFTPASSGSIYKEPNADSVLAAKLCLDGAVVLPNALWFNQVGLRSWASLHRPYVTTIGGHAFYA